MLKGSSSKRGRVWLTGAVVLAYISVAVCLSLLLFVNTHQPKWAKEFVRENNPYELMTKRDYLADVSDLAIQGNFLYVLYDNYDIMEVYTLQGSYQRAYIINSSSNGISELYCDEDSVWLKGKDYSGYQFRDGLFEKKIAFDRNKRITSFKNETSKRTSSDGTVYQTRWASVICKAADGSQKKVIDRPAICVFASGKLLVILWGLFVVGPLAVIGISRKLKEHFSTKNPLCSCF